MAHETKVYPVKGRFLMGVPHSVHSVPTKAEADALEASGAFTTNARSADRDDDAPEIKGDPIQHQSVTFHGEGPPPEGASATEGPAETGGSSDSSEE